MATIFGLTRVVALLVSLLLTAVMARGQDAAELTDNGFYELRQDKEKCLLVLAHASWSYQSKHAKVVANRLAAYMPTSNYSEVIVAMIDVHKYRRLARVESVVTAPTFIFYTFGGPPTHYGFHDDGKMVAEMLTHVAERLDNDKHHRMLEQERQIQDAKWNIPHPNLGHVVDFNSEDDFYKITHDITRTILVMFYAKWCEGCKDYASQYAELAAYFKVDPKIVIAKVDAERFPDLANKYNVEGYPTLVIFFKNKEGKIGRHYQGDRDVHHMIGHLTQHHQMMVNYDSDASAEMDEIEHMAKKMEEEEDKGDEQTKKTRQNPSADGKEPDYTVDTFPADGRL